MFGTKTGIRLQIDDTPLIIRPFVAMSPNVMSTTFATNLDWVERLSTGQVLRINNGRIYRFPLDGLREGLVKLRACAAKHRKRDPATSIGARARRDVPLATRAALQ